MQLRVSFSVISALNAVSTLAWPTRYVDNHQPRADAASIMYVGNTGSNGTWGSNFHLIHEDELQNYQYLVEFVGQHTEGDWTVGLWNKIGRGGKQDGMFEEPATTFVLSPGATQWVGIDSNSQGAWSAMEGDLFPRNSFGQVMSTWGEFDFGDQKNGGWLGFDVSVIVAHRAGHSPEPMKICVDSSDICSWWGFFAGETKEQSSYNSSNADADGIGGNLPSNSVKLRACIAWDGAE